jgi:microcystin degradation protein MlrC
MTSLRELAGSRALQAQEAATQAELMAKRHQRWQYGVGVPGAVATAISAGSLLTDVPHVASIIAVVASALTAVAGFLGSSALARHHWRRHAGLSKLKQKFENIQAASEEPTRADMDALADEWERWMGGTAPD